MTELHSFHLTQHTLSTMLLDAIQFFPDSIPKAKAESHGLLFGIKQGQRLECDYAFPVGNVSSRSRDEIEPNPKIDQTIKVAKGLVSTTQYIGTYHSHPNDKFFEEWAYPSNMDVDYAKYLKAPYMCILALKHNGRTTRPTSLQYIRSEAVEFTYVPSTKGHAAPKMKRLQIEVQSIRGELGKYLFEIRAYHFDGELLRTAFLYSSEAEVLMKLAEEKIELASITKEQTFRLRKMEYNLRSSRLNDTARDAHIEKNTSYHLNRIKEKRETD